MDAKGKKRGRKPTGGRKADKMYGIVGQAKRDDEGPLRELLKSIGMRATRINVAIRAIKQSESGRPKAEIDQYVVQLLISKGNSVADVATVLGISQDTLERNCKQTIELGRALMRGNLRVLQLRHAEKYYAMAIFLGKQILGQSDVLRTDKFTDDELLARLRDAGVDIRAAIAAASTAEADDVAVN